MTSAGASAQSFINYESGPVNPIRISDDGSRLYIADTLGGRLSVFDLSNPDQPFLRAEIPVGMDPVSVHPRTLNEVWVANLLSDSISIVDVSAGRVVDTLRVVDEPSDVVFAGGKAFVTAATRDEVHVFNAITRAPLEEELPANSMLQELTKKDWILLSKMLIELMWEREEAKLH